MGDYVPDADLQQVLDSLSNDEPTVSTNAVTPSPHQAAGNIVNQSDVLNKDMFLTGETIRLPTNGPIQQRKRNSTNINYVSVTVPAPRRCIGFVLVYGDQETVWVHSIDLDGPLNGTVLKQGMVLKSVNGVECTSYQSFVNLIQKLENVSVTIKAYSPMGEVLLEQERFHLNKLWTQLGFDKPAKRRKKEHLPSSMVTKKAPQSTVDRVLLPNRTQISRRPTRNHRV